MIRRPARHLLPVLAAAACLQLTACGADPTTPASSTDPSGAGATGEGSAGATRGVPGWTDLDGLPEDVALAAGRYGLSANGVSPKVAVVRAPAGFQALQGWTFVDGDPFRAMGFVTADRVYPDPCGSTLRHKEATAVDPGPTVADLAAALVAQQGVTTSKPRPVTVDGHDGLYLDYRVSRGVDVERCGDRAFDVFSTGPGAWYLETSRERAAIWILDVDGERLVLGWVAFPGVPRAQRREMTAMAESTHFVDPE